MSNFRSLNLTDIGHSLLIAIGTALLGSALEILTGLNTALQSGAAFSLPSLHDVLAWLVAGVVAGLTNVAKRYFTNSSGQIASEQKPTA